MKQPANQFESWQDGAPQLSDSGLVSQMVRIGLDRRFLVKQATLFAFGATSWLAILLLTGLIKI